MIPKICRADNTCNGYTDSKLQNLISARLVPVLVLFGTELTDITIIRAIGDFILALSPIQIYRQFGDR